MEENRILVLADDLTGALEVGAKFAANGVRSVVLTGSCALPGIGQANAGAVVVDTETRHASATTAAHRVFAFAQAALALGIKWIYKKTDSTLRGNIGAELAALIEASAGSPLLYVPAYPRMGRTVRQGHLYVDNVLVSATCFATDPLNPVTESHIPTLLAAQCGVPLRSSTVDDVADAARGSIAVCDGETDLDIQAAARAFVASSAIRLAAGPAALAAHLARLLDLPRCRADAMPKVRRGLIVNGSLHALSRDQVEQAKRERIRTIDARPISAVPAENGWAILDHESESSNPTVDFTRTLAGSVLHLLKSSPFDALVVFGGDTAHAIVDAMGSPALHPIGEVMEGVPICRLEATQLGPAIGRCDHDLIMVTKAGGFGPKGVITDIRNSLTER